MAKNVLQKKKRISHFQRTVDTEEGSEFALSGCDDVVSEILLNMDSNLNSLFSDYSKGAKLSMANSKDQREDNSALASSKNSPDNSSRCKKISLSRKFPLMEKSQKILKQLKHNQKSIPKPRAHLAIDIKSPSKNATQQKPTNCNATKPSNLNKREKPKEMCKLGAKNSLFNDPSNNISPQVNKNSNMSKISKNLSKADNKIEKNVKSKKSLEIDIKTNTNKEMDTLSHFENNGDTTDSEYERFVTKNKKASQKKKSLRQKPNATKNKASAKKLKRKQPASTLEKSESYNCDGSNTLGSSSNVFKTNPLKKQKIASKGLDDDETKNVLEDFEPDTILDDVCTRDSSAESDNEETSTNRFQPLVENAAEPFNELNTLSDATSLYTSSCQKKNTPEAIISDCTVSNNDAPRTCSYENNSISVKIEQSNLPSNSMVIDLCDSDDDSSNVMPDILPNVHAQEGKAALTTVTENCTVTKNEIHPDSDESDIEVIEFIPNQQKVKSIVSADRLPFNTTAGKEEMHVKIENASVDNEKFPIIVKTENIVGGYSTKALHAKSPSARDIDDESKAVYMTNICNEFSHTKVVEQLVSNKSEIDSKCSKALDISSKDSSLGGVDLKNIKTEIEPEDEIVVLRTVETSVLHSTKVVRSLSNRSTVQNENIKLEPFNSENVSKLGNSVHAESKTSETCVLNQELQNFVQFSSADLLDLYKREFDIYMEMKEAEANVEASLKNLQMRQAEKVCFIRSLFKKYIGDGPKPTPPYSEGSTSQALMHNKPPPISPMETPKDSGNSVPNVPTNLIGKFLPDNESSFSPQIVSTSSVGRDVKPVLDKPCEDQTRSELRHTLLMPKLEAVQENLSSMYSSEAQSVQKQTLKLSTEKCNVCGKEAIAACQGCAKVFFCSHDCGKKFWKDGHGKVCGAK